MKRLKYILFLTGVMLFCPAQAQNKDQIWDEFKNNALQEFNAFRDSSVREFTDFRKKINAEFADFLRNNWITLKTESPVPVPEKPEPPVAPVYVPATEQVQPVEPIVPTLPSRVNAPAATITELPEVHPFEVHDDQLPYQAPQLRFSLFGYSYVLPVPTAGDGELTSLQPEALSEYWNRLSDGRYHMTVNALMECFRKNKLCDWNRFLLLQQYAAERCGADAEEAVVLQAYLLLQCGWSVRLARSDEHLYLLMPTDVQQFRRTFFRIGGRPYYVMNREISDGETVRICDFKWPEERWLNLYTSMEQDFPDAEPIRRVLKSEAWPEARAVVPLNRNLLDFYASYPHCHWTVYADMSLSKKAKRGLYPALKEAIAGKEPVEAADILLNFVQTAFAYQRDEEQFGGERSLFADETLYYPYSDCEDRSILYSVLVRDLLGLKVVLLDYPNHISTAVHFEEHVPGDAVLVDDLPYLICDPTYVNAHIGQSMPSYRGVSPEVYKLRSLD